MGQILYIKKEFINSIEDNIEIIISQGYDTPEIFLKAIIDTLNSEYNFFEILDYELCNNDPECKQYSQYSAFVSGDDLPYDKVVIFFTPISTKIGDVIIEQSIMPTIYTQMCEDLNFLIDNKYKKIAVLTSKINKNNYAPINYNKLQMDVNSLNTLNIDVIAFFKIANLSTDTKFNSLEEYLDMSNYLQRKMSSNSQFQYLTLKDGVLYGNCTSDHIKGQFTKSFCFRFLTAIFSGKHEYKYDISNIKNLFDKLNNQFLNLDKFINYVNSHSIFISSDIISPGDNDIVIMDDILDEENLEDISRTPERALDTSGRMRFKVQKRIKDNVLHDAQYLCKCHDHLHFYFESIDNHNYIEGHHLIPMNRQEEYYLDRQVNLDNKYNIIPLCPNCHCQIHFGSRKARLEIITKLFLQNEYQLKKLNTDITLQLLASYYNIGLDDIEAEELLRLYSK